MARFCLIVGPSWYLRFDGSGGKWHLWTSVQGEIVDKMRSMLSLNVIFVYGCLEVFWIV